MRWFATSCKIRYVSPRKSDTVTHIQEFTHKNLGYCLVGVRVISAVLTFVKIGSSGERRLDAPATSSANRDQEMYGH